VGGLILLFAVAFLLTRSTPEDVTSGIAQTASVSVTGNALPDFDPAVEDTAVGAVMPEASGTDFDSDPVALRNDGRAKLVLFLAHWCPHCQSEVPVVQEWLDSNGMPEGVDLYSVSTGVDEAQPNYPPSEWLDREGWTVPVLRDNAAGDVATAYGVSGFPFFVFVNSEGDVVGRASGELPIETIEATLDQIE
jgi:thiol-disulfide isomerase/thioredoxin